MTGAPWVVEGGVLGGPVMITGTYSVGVVRDGVNSYFHEVLKTPIPWHQPVVGETSDAFLNDGQGQHVTKAHAFEALTNARPGAVVEGNVGGGTGMVAHGFKGGIGTSSRVVGDHIVGRSGAGQLRHAREPDGGRRAGGPRSDRRRAPARAGAAGRSRRLDHRRGRHHGTAPAPPARTPGASRADGHRAAGRHGVQRLRRHLHRLLDGQSGRRGRYRPDRPSRGSRTATCHRSSKPPWMPPRKQSSTPW